MKILNKIIILPLFFLTGCNMIGQSFDTDFYNKNPVYKKYIDTTIAIQFLESFTLIQIIDSMENYITNNKIEFLLILNSEEVQLSLSANISFIPT